MNSTNTNDTSSILHNLTTSTGYQPSNTKLKYDRIKLRSRQKHKQPALTSNNPSTGPARSLSNSSQGLKSDDFIIVDDFDDDDMLYENANGIKNAKSLGYLTASSVSNGGGSHTGTGSMTCDESDRMRRSLSNYTYLNGSSGTGSSYFYRENGSRHSLKPLSTSNGSLNNNWYKPKSLQLPPASNVSSSNLESALNGPPTTTFFNKTGIYIEI